jgi:predicted DNA-binding ribbon-helix-helix protein
MVKDHFLRAKTNLRGLFRKFRGLFTRFLTPFERKNIFEAKSSAALRGTKRACTLYLDTTTALALRLLSDHRKITMSQLVEQLVNKEWEEDRGKALNATSMTRFRKKLHKILRRIIW